MPPSKASSVITLELKPRALRWALVLPILLVIVTCWFTTRWCIGNTVAEYGPPAAEGGVEMAQLAARWAPRDPMVRWRLGSLEEKTFNPDNLPTAVREYQAAVEASPYDYRYWMEFGHALETTGDSGGAEQALRRALELAPAYAHPRWVYGNFLLREGRTDEAFQELSRAANADEVMRPSVFTLAWQLYKGDLDAIIKAVPSPVVRLQFVVYLIGGNNFDEAARVLHSVNEEDRREHSQVTADIIKSLTQKHHFHAALAILREVESDKSQLPTPEKVWDGGFEKPLVPKDERPFHWLFTPSGLAQMSIDMDAHSGNGSLRIVFKAPGKMEIIPISQTIIVEPDTQYRLQFYQRSADLVSAATPSVAVIDLGDNTALAGAPGIASGTHDWQVVTLDFKTKKTDGIILGIYRGSCGEGQAICPIFGTVWYDDFNLQRLSPAGAPAKRPDASQR